MFLAWVITLMLIFIVATIAVIGAVWLTAAMENFSDYNWADDE